MNDNRDINEICSVAFHEAAHAMMCIVKGAPVTRLIVNQEADEDGRLGCCFHLKAKSAWDNAWISLAGPAADCINKKISMSFAFRSGGCVDFDNAYASFGKLLYPAVPSDLHEHIGKDVRAYLDASDSGWRPAGVNGKLKRKLTLFTKRCVEADEFICDLVHREAFLVQQYLEKTPGLLDAISYLATHLADVREMSGREGIDLMLSYFEERPLATQLAA